MADPAETCFSWGTLRERGTARVRELVRQGAQLPVRLWRWAPIIQLGAQHRSRVERHLLSLGSHDRYLRFGYPASDERIRQYAQSLDFEGDEVFGIFNRRLELIAIAHLAYLQDTTAGRVLRMAEFAVSVRATARGRGLGNRLFAHATRHGRNRGVDRLFIHALSENTVMLRIARQAGASVQREGSESEAWLQLPPVTLRTRAEALLARHLAQLNYAYKLQTRQICRLVDRLSA
ncbi:acetyltransferase (GNAT) family protein [Sphaerotilus hippei]|uniref:Acetyltransferase (GNAT) family protein n=1 Tax=Sphaerotilus hippei TaxID=744406 RepID=A0A318H1F9_9BURK|nr:GNAT family N-acetyltransferase [Sphaerotilus hippei]PXW96975.1 acetyltransferase (GNAT) family protein [Sphaerotilus hippei]